MNLKFRTKLLLINISAISLVSSIMLAGAYSIISHQMQEETQGFLEDEFNEYSLKYQQMLSDMPALTQDMLRHFTQARMTYPIVCRLHNNKGETLVNAENLPGMPQLPVKTVLSALNREQVFYKTRSEMDGSPYWFLLKRMESPDREVYVFELGLDIEHLEGRIVRLRNNMLLLVAAIMVLTFVVALACTKKTLQPFEDLNNALHTIRSSSLDQRLPLRGTRDEIDTLADELNQMLTEIEDSFSHIRDFTADAAHELRTPLTHLMLLVEQNLNRPLPSAEAQELLDQIYENCFRLQKMIDDLMLLARLDIGQVEDESLPCALDEILLSLEELWRTVADEAGMNLVLKIEPQLRLQGRPVLLRRLFVNLFDNAVRHTPAGGTISIIARDFGHQYKIIFSNTGSGIPTEELSKIFQRFYRVDPSRNSQTGGTGLGLNICQKICALHLGSIRAESIENQESRFFILLPKSTPTSSRNFLEKHIRNSYTPTTFI